jgi:hypothetical protein
MEPKQSHEIQEGKEVGKVRLLHLQEGQTKSCLMVQIPGNNAANKRNVIHTTYSRQSCSCNSSNPWYSTSVLAIIWHRYSTFQSKNLSCSSLWDTAYLARPHRTESKEAGDHRSHVSKKSTVHLQICANQTSVSSSWYHLFHWWCQEDVQSPGKHPIPEVHEKAVTIPEEFYRTDRMLTDNWKRPNFKLKNTYMIYGFCGRVCMNRGYHDPGQTCRCALCGKKCTRYRLGQCGSTFHDSWANLYNATNLAGCKQNTKIMAMVKIRK